MTGAGSSTLAFVKEDSLGTLPGTPTYYQPGRDVTVDELSIDNQLQRLREAGKVEAANSLAGRLDGTLSLSWAMDATLHQHVRDIVFNDGGTGFKSGEAATSRWYIGSKYFDGGTTDTVERELIGCIPLEYSISYEAGTNTIRENLTLGFGEETANTSITPPSITTPTDGDETAFHGLDLSIDGVATTREQSATLSFSNISRFQNGASRSPEAAVLANPETSLDLTAIYGGRQYQDLAYGGSGVSDPQDSLSNVSGQLTLSDAGATVATYSLPKLKPTNYDWSGVINGDEDLTDPVSWHVNGGVSIT